jgi:phage shock protein A
MWARIKAIFRSLFGWLLRSAENPELILRQYIDELREKVPEMNRQVAEVVKMEKMLMMQQERLQERVGFLEPQVVQAVKLGPEKKDAAKTLITALEQAKQDLAATETQLGQAHENSERMKRARSAFIQQINQKMAEAKNQISRAKRAEVEEKLAEVMGSFEMGDTSETLDRMTAHIDERLARAQARTEIAATSVEAQLSDVGLSQVDDAAERKYVEYQRQLGILPPEPATERTMESVPVEEQKQAQAEPPQEQTQ